MATLEKARIASDELEDGARRNRADARRSARERFDELGDPQLRLPTALLAVTVAGSVLAIGTVHLSALVVVATVAFTGAAVALYRQAQYRGGLVFHIPAIVFTGLAAYTLLQAVPLPISWLKVVAPDNADVWERCLLPFGETGLRWAPISLDPGASCVEVLRWLTYAAVFATSAAVASRAGAAQAILIVFGSAALAAFVTLCHGLVGATTVYGIFRPNFDAAVWHIGPLLNPNNLSGYMNLGAFCGLGLMLSRRPTLPRWLLGLGVALVVATDITSASRAGVAALFVGAIALALMRRKHELEVKEGPRASTWLIATALVGGATLAALGFTDNEWAELRDKDLSKLRMVLWAKPLVRDHPWLGVGRGAFASVFPRYRFTPGNAVYTHIENFVVQWIAEWGLLVTFAALLALAISCAPARLGVPRRALNSAAWVGITVLLAQNLVDLALEVPAICIAAAAVLGALFGETRRETRSRAIRLGPVGPKRARLIAVVVGALGAGAIVAAAALGRHDVASDRSAAYAAEEAARTATPAGVRSIRDALRHAMLRHPAEPYFPLVGALLAFQTRDESPIPWLERALERSPMNSRAHILLAEVLSRSRAKNQAFLELRLAVDSDPELTESVATLALRWTNTFDDLMTVVPEGKQGGSMLAAMAGLLANRNRPGDALLRGRCDREALLRAPDLIVPRLREATACLTALANGGAPDVCIDRPHCRAEILEQAGAIAEEHPDSSVSFELRARLLVADGKPEEAAKMLEKSCELVSDRERCQWVRADVAAHVRAPMMLEAASTELLGMACQTALDCADTATWLASLRSGRGETGTALALLGRAAREIPGNEARWLRLADAASRAGAHAQAAEALDRVAKRRGGSDPDLRSRVEAERAQALDGLLTP